MKHSSAHSTKNPPVPLTPYLFLKPLLLIYYILLPTPIHIQLYQVQSLIHLHDNSHQYIHTNDGKIGVEVGYWYFVRSVGVPANHIFFKRSPLCNIANRECCLLHEGHTLSYCRFRLRNMVLFGYWYLAGLLVRPYLSFCFSLSPKIANIIIL